MPIKVDVGQWDALSNDENICTLPAFLMYKNGQQIDRRDGALNAADFRKWIEGA